MSTHEKDHSVTAEPPFPMNPSVPVGDDSGDWDMHALDAGFEEFPHDE